MVQQKYQEELECELLNYKRNRMTNKEIAKQKGVLESTIRRWLSKIDPVKLEEAKREGERRKEEKLLEYIKQGKTHKQIAEVEGVSDSSVEKWLSKIDPVKLEGAKREAEKRKEEKLLEYIRQGKTYLQIAQKEETCESNIAKWIYKIAPQKLEQAKQEAKRRKEQEILELIKEDKKIAEIANIKGNAYNTMARFISQIDTTEVDKAKQKAKLKRNQKIKQDNEMDKAKDEIRLKLKQGTILDKDIELYRQLINGKLDSILYDEVKLMLEIYIKTKQTDNALDFIKLILDNPNISQLEKELLHKMKEQIETTQKVKIAKVMLEQEKPTIKVINQTGLKEKDVIEMKNRIEKINGITI